MRTLDTPSGKLRLRQPSASTYRTTKRPYHRINGPLLLALFVYVAALPLFLNFGLPVYTATQRALAWAIFAAAGVPILRLLGSHKRGVPLLALVAGQYIVFYALAVFFEDETKTLDGWIVPSSSAVDMTLVCVLLSLLAIGMGYSMAGRLLPLRFNMFNFIPSTHRLFWYAIATIVGALLLQLGNLTLLGWSPGGLLRPVSVVLSADLSIAILACLFYQGALQQWQRVAAVLVVCVSVVVGFAGGMFQSVVQPLLIWAICRWIIKGKAPIAALLLIATAFFVLQPVKGTYRSLTQTGRSLSTSQKISIYAGLIQNQWFGTGNDLNSVMQDNRVSAKKRLSLLLATSHYVDWTPYPVDYKNGATFGYLIYGWIPRAVWPDKPIAQQANKILPVEYNVQGLENQTSTMFGVGHVAEAYVNFGLIGILPVFMFLGALYRIPQLLLERRRTTATIAIFVAAGVAMVGIGSSISDAFGGFLQQILIQGFLLRLFTSNRKSHSASVRARQPGRLTPWTPATSLRKLTPQSGQEG